ncbi:P-loop containing nucleoside triphosphate hydrolase superfamily protein [Zea mays]|nr:P-loop containing nucleoside triphosphate hydrolase superfamily protein [Zea mays]
MKLKSPLLKKEVLQKLVKLGGGWRIPIKNLDVTDAFQLAKAYRIRDLYLVWSIDLEKNERYFQMIRVWDLLSQQHVARTVQHLENLFSMYTDEYLDHCRSVQTEGKLEFPIVWDAEHDIVRYKKDCKVDDQVDHDHLDFSCALENTKVSESFLLMKFYSLSSGVAHHLLTATDGTEIEIPFELTDEEEAIIRFPLTSFILGRSGTGKTTVLTMKLYQIEQHSFIASQGIELEVDLSVVDPKDRLAMDTRKGESFVKQVLITVSPKLCSAIKNHICRLKRFCSGDVSDQPNPLHMYDVIDDPEEFTDVPDNFSDLQHEHYPLTITYRKFLMMLDGTMKSSFFDMFYGDFNPSIERGHSKTRAMQAFIESKEVTFEKFAAFYWPHFNGELTKKLDASTVFTEIISHIKGGYRANMPCSGKLERLDYVMLSDKRFSSLNSKMREKIYDVFLDYESMKRTAREFDLSDFVNSLHRSLVSEGYNGALVDFIYIDEVQDLTMSQIALLKYVCRNFKEGFVFAGDTAQTIARGVDFRFEDVRSLFYTSFISESEACNQVIKHGNHAHLTDMFQLSQNFRTHCGVLRMAQSIMSLLYYFFPSCVDKLNPETGLVYGEAPVLLESGNDENAIMTIFGESRGEHADQHGFGAEQVILVRDVATKKQIVNLVGKQALVLTIVECKGLEFQDVLLYNFFSSSPLRNKWRVVYDYMKTRDVTSSSEVISHPGFDRNKHYLLCSELKQLYVAITRTRQRLWICENADDYCQPMFDYWKKLCIVEVRLLDSSLIQAMQTGSSTDDWRLRGTKLFNEGQFEMATMCFEKAGDAYRENWARAAGLLATADRVISTNLERGQANLQKASEIYESIGMHEKAATCYIKLGDYKRAGMIYMEKFGTKRLEDAGDCFAITECWSLAAEVYFRARCYTKCFSCCSKGKALSLGLQFLRQLEKEQCENFSSDFVAVRKTYLESCALHYFKCGDIKHMMPYVKAFNNVDHIRAFLSSRNLLDELLSIEMEMGNFLEAAGIAQRKGDVLLEVNILEKAESFVNATHLLLLYVTANSLWSPHSRGWPPESFEKKEQLLTKVKEMAKKVSEDFFCLACFEADLLSDSHRSLASLTCSLLEGRKCGNMLVELISARYIIDVHLQSQTSRYNLELEPVSDQLCYNMMACDQMSLETLSCIWNQWKLILVKVLAHLNPSEDIKSNDSAAVCEDLCAKLFGLRKDSDNRYVVLNVDSGWLTNTGRSSLEQDGNRCWLHTVHCQSCARTFMVNELSSVGLSVLRKLESIIETSREIASSPYAQWRSIVILYEIAMFLKEFCLANSLRKTVNFCEQKFFELLFRAWGDETAECFSDILDSSPAYGLIVDSVGSYTMAGNQNLTHGHLGRIAMFLLYTAKYGDMLNLTLEQYLNRDAEWAQFFQSLKSFLDTGVGRCSLVQTFKVALEFTTNVKWWIEKDYMSPICYMNLMECLGFFAMSCFMVNGCALCTKSLLVKMLKCRTSKAFLGNCLVSGLGDQDMDLDCMTFSPGVFICQSIRSILTNKHAIQEWIREIAPAIRYVPVLLRLVIMLYLLTLTLQLGDCYEVTDFLAKHRIFEDLPPDFSKKIVPTLKFRNGTVAHFTRVFGDALAAIGDTMVILGLPKGPLISSGLKAYRFSYTDLSDISKVMALLCPEEQKFSMQKDTKAWNDTCGNLSIARIQDNEMVSRIETHLSDESITFWEKFESFQVFMHDQKDSRVIILFLESLLSWLERRDLPENMDVQLFVEIRHICSQFQEKYLRDKKVYLTVEDLYSTWDDGENKLQKIISFLRYEKTSGKESVKRKDKAPAAQFPTHMADEWSGCSDNDEPDTAGMDAVEPAKEEDVTSCSTATATATKRTQNKKGKKKSRKRGGKK